MKIRTLIVLCALVLAAGCVTLGRDFPVDPVGQIVNGRTTREQVLATFGEPFQKGVENGKESWTYYLVRYGGSRSGSKELHLVFGGGVVESYSFTATNPER